MGSNEGSVIWLFEPESSPTSQTQVDELARGFFHHDVHDVPSTPQMWHPSLGAMLEDEHELPRYEISWSRATGYETTERETEHETTAACETTEREMSGRETLEAKIIEGPWLREPLVR